MEEMKLNLENEQEVNAEIKRRVREEMEKVRAEWEAQAAQERLAGMTGDERAAYDMACREAELEERERQLTERELRAMALEKLAERGLPRELAEALPYSDEEKCLAGIDTVEEAFRKAVQAAVDARLRGKAPVGDANRTLNAEALTDSEYYSLSAGKIL